MIELREYQKKGIKQTYEHFKLGNKKICLWLATGGGKSFTMCRIIQDALTKDLNVVVIVRRRQLILQMSQNLDKWDIEHGVFMAGHYRYFPQRKVQVCSVDTIRARDKFPFSDDNTLVLIDEAHDCKSKTYQKVFDQYSGKYILGVTATPFTDMSMFDAIVNPITARDLMMDGFLVPDKVFIPKEIIMTHGIKKTSNGDFNNRELFAAASTNKIMGDLVSSWRQYANGRRTILFAVNVDHSKMICKRFNEAGIPAIHCDANSPQGERNEAINKLKSGEISVLCNVNIFSTGVDIPEIECIQYARPTESLIFWIQSVGRGLRPSAGKTDCIIIDNAGNALRHGSVYTERTATTDKPSSKSIKEKTEIDIRECEKCGYVYDPNEQKECPECGHKKAIKREYKYVDGELQEMKLTDEQIEAIKVNGFVSDYAKLDWVAKSKNLKENFIYYKLRDKYGVDFCRRHGKRVRFPEWMLK